MRHAFPLLCLTPLLLLATQAQAHVSEQAFVLLLPTQHYIIGGCVAVAASILLVSLLPSRWVRRMFTPYVWHEGGNTPSRWQDVTSLLSFSCLAGMIYLGFEGPRAPLSNLMPLMLWTGWWIVLVSLLGIVGDLWRWVNPWTGLYHLIFGRTHQTPVLTLPERWGIWPAWVIFIAFFGFFIADIAPNDPDRLALITLLFWTFNFTGMALFGGAPWIARCEAFSVAFALLARVSPFGERHTGIGAPGWDLTTKRAYPIGLGVFALTLLAAGSFDGLKETFWWLGQIDVNPLEFPGRSAVVMSSLLGLGAAVLGLIAAFVATCWMGRAMATRGMPHAEHPALRDVFGLLAPCVLPIAVGYHISHFLVSFLIEGQYLLAALGDPLANGANILGLADIRVTSGFLNSIDSVRTIWLTQAGAVLVGHILSVLVSHHAALRLFQNPGRAALSQIPLGLFMIAYTLFGLWLLATPRGM